MKREDLDIVFIGFDGYKDLWDDCMNLYNHFWEDRPYKTYFVNNVEEVAYEDVTVLHAGSDAEWSKKVQIALANTTAQYICLLLEDFFVGKKIDNKLIATTLELIRDNDLRYFKLTNMSRAVKNSDPLYKNYDYLHVIPESDDYGVSLQAAIWERSFLEELVGKENYNAWIFEFNQVKKAQGKSDKPLEGCVFDERNILNLKHGVVQGKYIPSTVAYFQELGMPLHIKREVLSEYQYLKIMMRSKVKFMLPKRMRKPVKKIAEKLGMKFVSTIRDKE
ncbi:hypothetical protein [Streptococcus massiliensis]|uniref:Uncharacterized protein n=1 Tax=Streptococcus massiliensis TaxID=313439 RepID=A0A380KXQ0_9STRE|nr:hypothetical protein [Streptococcus massiliensis]SUN76468.1 Uncharacterised protein [Streptococcus massiliensis]